ncbi:unnamed protein product [Ilex paraguariensis]|uniref:Uncharacterized protein n=1 Tax=Ilex paraguariensis TaxID=185542 RepID=A0ABC8SBA9_9AQUA
MASCGVFKSSFLPSLHIQDGYSSSSLLAAAKPILPSNKRKFTGVVAAQDNKASKENDVPVKRDDSTKINGQATRTLNFSGEKPITPILDTINHPIHMNNLSVEELEKLQMNSGKKLSIPSLRPAAT